MKTWKKVLIWGAIILVLAVGVAVGGYYGLNALFPPQTPEQTEVVDSPVVKELEEQIAELEQRAQLAEASDAEKAQEIVGYKEQLAQKDSEQAELQNKLNINLEQMKNMELEKSQLITERDQYKAQTEEDAEKIASINAQLAAVEKQLETADADKVQLAAEKIELTKQLNDAQNSLETANQELATANTRIEKIEEELTGLQASNTEFQRQIQSLKDEKVELKEKLDIAQLSLEEKQSELSELNSKLVELQTLLAHYVESYEPISTDKFAVVTYNANEKLYAAQVLKKGTTAEILEPTIDGFEFLGWMLNGTVVTYNSFLVEESITFTASLNEIVLSFGETSWGRVVEISEEGKASEYWELGDEKQITLSTGEVITVVIVGFNHDNLADGSGKAGITLGMKDCLDTLYPMGNKSGNVGGWSSCIMRTETMPMLLSQLPLELRAGIKTVAKETSAGENSKEIVISNDKLWLFSEYEVTLNSASAFHFSGEGEPYEYYINNEWQYRENRIKKSNGEDCAWFLRSPTRNKLYFECVWTDGYTTPDAPQELHGVSFGFCI